MYEGITAAKDVALGIAAMVTAGVAVIGLQSWQREMKGRAEYERARALARAVYSLRNELTYCRSSFIPASEFPPGYDGGFGVTNPQQQADAYHHIFKGRWAPVVVAINELDAQTLEAEAVWGAEVRTRANELRQCVQVLRAAWETYIDDKLAGGEIFRNDNELRKQIQREVFGQASDEKNALSLRIMKAVERVDEFIKPHLRRK